MAKLCIYLPPFASDYTGVCSALFEIDCLTAINDASCCTAHYVYYDEPRWAKKVRPIFCTQLRTIDAVMGNDSKVVDCVLETAETIESDIIAVVGTPVPAITGMDMIGISNEIENRCGKMTFGFSTTGFDYYDRGITMVEKALIERLAEGCQRCSNKQKKGIQVSDSEKYSTNNFFDKTHGIEKDNFRTSHDGESQEIKTEVLSNNSMIDGQATFFDKTQSQGVNDSGIGDKKFSEIKSGSPDEDIRVNIIGLTPLDYGDTELPEKFKEELEKNGITVNVSLSMNGSIEDYKNITNADLCIAVSAAGLATCKYIKNKFGIPYIAAAPMGSVGMLNIISHINSYFTNDDTVSETCCKIQSKQNNIGVDAEKTCAHEKNIDIYGEKACTHKKNTDVYAEIYLKSGSAGIDADKFDASEQVNGSLLVVDNNVKKKVIIVDDQIMANSLRDVLRFYGISNEINVVSFFSWDKKLAQSGDKKINSEKDFIDLLKKENYHVIIADPMFGNVPEVNKMKHLELVHPAVSGKLHWKDAVNYLSPDFDSILKSWAQVLFI